MTTGQNRRRRIGAEDFGSIAASSRPSSSRGIAGDGRHRSSRASLVSLLNIVNLILLENPSQTLERDLDAPSQCPFRLLQNHRDLVKAHLLEVSQHQEVPVRLFQLIEARQKRSLPLIFQ